MDYQNRIGSKKGSGGVASQQEQNIQTKKRVSKLFDISNDPYVFKNHLGQLECKLCLTLHSSSESYMNHVNGRKHQLNLQKRSILEARSNKNHSSNNNSNGITNELQNEENVDKSMGVPSYKITKIRKLETNQLGLFITIKYPSTSSPPTDDIQIEPQYRFMSSFESNDLEKSSDHQYLIFHFDKFENIGIKLMNESNNLKVDFDSVWKIWDNDLKEFYFQFLYESKLEQN